VTNIIHIDVPDFCIAVERVLEPRLQDRPMIVAVETAQRSLVYAVSQEARRCGIYRGQTLYEATKRCRHLEILPPNAQLYWRATHAMMSILQHFTPVFEPVRFGHAYMDMTGCGKLFGSIKDAAAKAQQDICRQLRLETTVGIAGNKLVSKVATDVLAAHGERLGLYGVKHGDERSFLAPLSIGYLGMKRKVRDELLDLNIRLNGELAAAPVEPLQMILGRLGAVLHQRARGIDPRPVQPPKRAPEIVESYQLDEDTNDYYALRSIMYGLLAAASQQLRELCLRTAKLSLSVQYSDYKTNTCEKRIIPLDTEIELTPELDSLFDQLLNRRIRVRKLTLKLGTLCAAPRQLSLFQQDVDPRIQAVTSAMDKIRRRFGDRAIRFGRAA